MSHKVMVASLTSKLSKCVTRTPSWVSTSTLGSRFFSVAFLKRGVIFYFDRISCQLEGYFAQILKITKAGRGSVIDTLRHSQIGMISGVTSESSSMNTDLVMLIMEVHCTYSHMGISNVPLSSSSLLNE